MITPRKMATCLALCVSLHMLSGCSKSELSRESARTLIERALTNNDVVVYEGLQGIDCARTTGLINASLLGISLTPQGEQYFKSARFDTDPLSSHEFIVEFIQPPTIKVISVDGISDMSAPGGSSPTMKEVEYTAEYDFSNVKLPSCRAHEVCPMS